MTEVNQWWLQGWIPRKAPTKDESGGWLGHTACGSSFDIPYTPTPYSTSPDSIPYEVYEDGVYRINYHPKPFESLCFPMVSQKNNTAWTHDTLEIHPGGKMSRHVTPLTV